MSLYPIFVKMAGRPALVVGGGSLAVTKIEGLLRAEAQVTVVAPQAQLQIREWRRAGRIEWLQRSFEASGLRGKMLVIAATGVREIDRYVFAACRQAGVLCNAVDDPEYCDFYAPALVRRGDLQIAISTNGKSPALAQQIRQELEVRFDASWEQRVAELGRRRADVLASLPPGPERNSLLHAQARAALRSSEKLRRLTEVVSRWLNSEDERVPLI